MSETILRKVMCSDRLPKEDGLYIAQSWKGICRHNFNLVKHTLNKHTSDWLTEIEWWLEEIQLPSEEDIVKIAGIENPKDWVERMSKVDIELKLRSDFRSDDLYRLIDEKYALQAQVEQLTKENEELQRSKDQNIRMREWFKRVMPIQGEDILLSEYMQQIEYSLKRGE